MIYDLNKFRERKSIAATANLWLNFWLTGVAVFLPKPEGEAKILQFPQKNKPQMSVETPVVK